MATYKYAPLNEHGQNEIRLMTLQPGAFHDRLRVGLQEVAFSLTTPPVYEALSYVWGSADDGRVPVQVCSPSGDHTVLVTQNLATALRHLRFDDRERVLWVDALCIDQSNLVERSQHVLKMGDVYKTGQRVVAWLGPESQDSSLALGTIARLAPLLEVDWRDWTLQPSAASGFESGSVTFSSGWLSVLPEEMRSVFHLISREWFERLWICQEIVLGGERSFISCGRKEIPWSSFRAVMYYMYLFKNQLIGDMDAHRFAERMSLILKLITLSPGVTLMDLRADVGMFRCSDPKDHIYGLLNLLHPWDQAIGITPNYSLALSQVYRNVALAWIGHHNSLEILSRCEIEAAAELPSWVPNWAIPPSIERRLQCPADVYHWSRLCSLPDVMDPDIDGLRISCQVLTTVEKVTVPGQLDYDDFLDWFYTVFPKSVHQSTYRGKGSLLEAYSRTICGNQLRDSFLPPNEWHMSQEECETAIKALLDTNTTDDRELSNCTELRFFLSQAIETLKGRCFFWGTDGYIGLAPQAAQPGDRVCHILGCYVPILLRSLGEELVNPCSVVGECYVHGLMHNEALFGDLPEYIRPVISYDEGCQGLQTQYLDKRNGQVQKEDPRVLELLVGMIDKGLIDNADVEEIFQREPTELLKSCGISLEYYTLV
ncbi:heterokaryon incompatibility protein-domain-containing protein [Xylaria cf. heliscus]|nr:heterokaryon incompatibility protein-domain-containing protein [Xylaria cf. heliscus]